MSIRPINHHANTVFIPIEDIEKAKELYKGVLGIEGGEIQFGHLFVADMNGTDLVLMRCRCGEEKRVSCLP